jgi:hypothetical protein
LHLRAAKKYLPRVAAASIIAALSGSKTHFDGKHP